MKSTSIRVLFSVLFMFAGGCVHAGELTITRVFGPEVPTGPYKHPACLTELENGDFYLVYYGGSGEYAIETAVFGSRLKKGEAQWTAPKPIASDPLRSVGNGVIWEAPDGVVWLFYVVRYGETWSGGRLTACARDGEFYRPLQNIHDRLDPCDPQVLSSTCVTRLSHEIRIAGTARALEGAGEEVIDAEDRRPRQPGASDQGSHSRLRESEARRRKPDVTERIRDAGGERDYRPGKSRRLAVTGSRSPTHSETAGSRAF